ncbi:MAG: hypothetical protein ACRDWW_02945, partial [Acidimicrobiales bacterium]
MNFVQATRAVRRRWWVPVVILIVAVAAVFALSPASSAAVAQYRAKAILLVNPSTNQSSTVNLQEAALETTVGAVPGKAAALLHYTGNPTVLAGQV